MIRRKEDWFLIFTRQAESGLSVKEFCHQNSISLSAFYNARRRHGLTKGSVNLSVPECAADPEKDAVTSARPLPIRRCSKTDQDEIQYNGTSASFIPIQVKHADSAFDKNSQPLDSAAAGINNEEPLQFLCGRVPITVSPSMSVNNLAVLLKACLLA